MATPIEISAETLQTLGESDLGGVVLSFSAHLHFVAARSALYGFGVRYRFERFGMPTRVDEGHR